MKSGTFGEAVLAVELGGVLDEISDGVSCPFDAGASMGPPSLFVGFGRVRPLGSQMTRW